MGPWPALIEKPRVEVVNTTRRENITQQQLRIEIALGGEMVDALLLVPQGEIPAHKRPAVLVVYYDAETGAFKVCVFLYDPTPSTRDRVSGRFCRAGRKNRR